MGGHHKFEAQVSYRLPHHSHHCNLSERGISLAQLVSLEDKSGNTANHEIKFQEEKILKSSNAAEAAKLQTSNQPNKKWCASGGWEGLIATLKLLDR